MDRRQFLKHSAVAVAALATAPAIAAEPKTKVDGKKKPAAAKPKKDLPFLASAPVLLNPAETTMGVMFAIGNEDASGWVDYATTPDLKNAQRAYSGAHGLRDVCPTHACIRLTGLQPATTYYYRIGADRIQFKGGYAMKNLGSVVDEHVYSFTTLGAQKPGSFCVINDTHNQKPALDAAFAKIAELKPTTVVWNGDASNTSETIHEALDIFAFASPKHPGYAANTPICFVPGNHDFRGRFNRQLGDLVMFRDPAERASVYAELGRNFVQRVGDIALIGLDTGEDKLDTNPLFANIFQMKPYRELQTRWLAETIETPAVKTAKFKVAFCHIPLFTDVPRANPGDLAPADTHPDYDANYAFWQRTCSKMWSPLFVKAGVQLVVCAHIHRYTYSAPTATRPWAHMTGGGPGTNPARRDLATVIAGQIEDNQLVVRVHDLVHGKVIATHRFNPS